MGIIFSKKFDPIQDLPSLEGKVVIVTGASRGIGYHTAKHLARKGAKVYIAARDESRATGAIAQLQAEGLGPCNGELAWLKLDLDDPRNARKAALEFMEREGRLDVLINNAALGFLSAKHIKGRDGLVDGVIVNYLSPYIFTEALLPLLTKTAKELGADVRIVNVASSAHDFVKNASSLRLQSSDDLNASYDGTMYPAFYRYALSKLLINLWTTDLQARLDESKTGIIALAPHPGAVNTFGAKIPPPFSWIVKTFFLTPDQGAHNSVFSAAATIVREEQTKYKGKYLVPVGKIARPSAAARKQKLVHELRETTRGIVEEGAI